MSNHNPNHVSPAPVNSKPEAYLNLKIQDSQGNFHNVRCYIPLTSDNNVQKAIMDHAKRLAEYEAKTGEKQPIMLHGSVNFVKNDAVEIGDFTSTSFNVETPAPVETKPTRETYVPTEVKEQTFTPAEEPVKEDNSAVLQSMQEQLNQMQTMLNKFLG